MDDGGIVGEADKLVAIWDMLILESPKLGLELNPAKCEWSWLDPHCKKPCPIRVNGAEDKQLSLVPPMTFKCWVFLWVQMKELLNMLRRSCLAS